MRMALRGMTDHNTDIAIQAIEITYIF